jgi:hypothetical protein
MSSASILLSFNYQLEMQEEGSGRQLYGDPAGWEEDLVG